MPEAREALREELDPYHTSKATYKFPVGQLLPVTLIKKVIEIQVMANEGKQLDI